MRGEKVSFLNSFQALILRNASRNRPQAVKFISENSEKWRKLWQEGLPFVSAKCYVKTLDFSFQTTFVATPLQSKRIQRVSHRKIAKNTTKASQNAARGTKIHPDIQQKFKSQKEHNLPCIFLRKLAKILLESTENGVFLPSKPSWREQAWTGMKCRMRFFRFTSFWGQIKPNCIWVFFLLLFANHFYPLLARGEDFWKS